MQITTTDISGWPCDHVETTRGNDSGALTCCRCGEEMRLFAEDLTPEGIQLVIPGAERIQPASVKQGELF